MMVKKPLLPADAIRTVKQDG